MNILPHALSKLIVDILWCPCYLKYFSFRCDKCDIDFSDESELKIHSRKVHFGDTSPAAMDFEKGTFIRESLVVVIPGIMSVLVDI